MKKFTIALLSIPLLGGTAFSQTTVNDSIQTGASYSNDVYYSFSTGKVKEVSNMEWQIAFSIGTFNVGIRTNTVTSSSGDGSVKIYEEPTKDTTKWSTFDTTGFANWSSPDNSDEDWELGAFNRSSAGLDYGWGVYNTSSHIITGNRLYLVAFKSGSSTLYKKLWILNKDLGNWNLKYANLDGSNAQSLQIKSSDYLNSNFAYLSLATDQVINHEPSNASWDFVLTRYAGLQPGPSPVYYPSTGILTNKGVLSSEVRGIATATSSLSDTPSVSSNISIIGADWKSFTGTGYVPVDSLSYFVKAKDGVYWKLVFTAFAGSSTGKTNFSKTKLTWSAGTGSIHSAVANLLVYPNPASSQIHILFDSEPSEHMISVTDITGREVLATAVSGNGFQNHVLNTSSLNKGVYFLNIRNSKGSAVQKFIVQ